MRRRPAFRLYALVDAVLGACNLIVAVQLLSAGAYVRAAVSAILALWMAFLFASDIRKVRAAS